MAGQVHFSSKDGVALLELDNPPANTLGRAMRTAFLAKLEEAARDSAIRAVIVTGRGRIFCSGDDLKEQNAALKTGADRAAQFGAFMEFCAKLEQCRLPVIAAVNGWCGGGGLELALCCDIRLASAKAQFVCAGVNVGLLASAWRLPRLIGVARAKEMLLTGLAFGAPDAERFGLVAKVCAPEKLLQAAQELAARIASRAPLSVEASKRLASMALADKEAAAWNDTALSLLAQSEDHKEALAAFCEKRPPRFTRS